MKTFIFSIILTSVCFATVDSEVALTIYNDNFGVIRQSRMIEFDEGLNSVNFTDVASRIDPTSVNFKCLSNPDAVYVLEQNYEYDLVNSDSLLKRYIDKDVTLAVKGSGADTGTTISGTLSAFVDNNYIITKDSKINIISKNYFSSAAIDTSCGGKKSKRCRNDLISTGYAKSHQTAKKCIRSA